MKIEEATTEFAMAFEAKGNGYGCLSKETLQMAIKALEKQIPKKPDLEGDGYADGFLVYDTWICPCCGMHYEVDYDDYKHCPECGQAIDWSDQHGLD